MSEEVKEGMSSITKTVIGAVTTIVTVVSGYVVTNVEKIFGTDEKEEKTEQVSQEAGAQGQSAAPAPVVINMTNNNTQQQTNSNGGGRTIIKETVREVPANQPAAATPAPEPKKETVAERMARLKAEKAAAGEGK
jgi:hypothetical protein